MKHCSFLCLILACFSTILPAERHVHPNADGDLVGNDGKPVFLISTTTHWGSMIEWYRHKHQFQGKWIQKYGWLYGQQICMDMFEKCGFNALNFREHGNVSWRALAPEYKGYSAKDPFDEYMEMTKKYKLEHFREMKTRREYDDFHNLIASAKNIPVYLDFHGGYIARITQNRNAFSALFPHPYQVFASRDTHPGFAFRFQFGTKEGRETLLKLYRHEAEAALSAGIQPFAYKLFNEADFRDFSPVNAWKFKEKMKKKYSTIERLNAAWHTNFPAFDKVEWSKAGTAGRVEYAKYLEDLAAGFFAEARAMLRKLDPGALTFGQVHSSAYLANWNNFNLYKINRNMDFISTGTGNFTFSQGEQINPDQPIAEHFTPNAELRKLLGRGAFTLALADRKPIVTTEAYFDGMGDRYRPFKKAFWYEMIQGSCMVNMWQWGCYFAPWVMPTINYGLRHPLCVSPESWKALPEVRREIASVSDIFQVRKNREKADVAVLFSYPTLRANNDRMDGYLQGISAMRFLQIPVDAVLEEQLPENRLDRYKVLLAFDVKNVDPATTAALRKFVRNGGLLIANGAMMSCDEYDFPLPDPLLPLTLKQESGNMERDPKTGIPFKNDFSLTLGKAPWKVLARFGNQVRIASLDLGKGKIIAVAGKYTDYGIAEVIRPYLKEAGISPNVTLRWSDREERPSGVTVYRFHCGALTGWAFVNFNDLPVLTRASAPEFKGAALVDPIGKKSWPVRGDTSVLLLPPKDLLILVSGPEKTLSARFGSCPAVAPDQAEKEWKLQCAELRKKKGYVRPSKPVAIDRYANYGYDNQQGWKTDTAWFDSKGKHLLGVPWHGVVFRNIQFELIRFDFNQNRTCIALKSKNLPDAPAQTAEIPLEGQFRGVAFLHAVTHGKAGETAMKYRFSYEDGSSVTVPVVVGKEIGDWRIKSNSPAIRQQTAWQKFGNGFFFYEWNNPQPTKKLKSLRIESGCGESVPIVVGISALPTTFTKTFRTSIPMQRLFDAVSPDPKCGWQKDGSLVCGPAAVSLKVRGGKTLRIPEERLKNAVLRFQLKHGKDQWGKQYPKSGYVWMTMFGKRDGRQVSSATQGSNVTAQIFAQKVSYFQNPADWNEVELPLSRLANFEAQDLPVIPEISSLHYGGGDRVHILRDFRIEY